MSQVDVLTYEQFAAYVKKHSLVRCTESFLKSEYSMLKTKTFDYMLKELPYISVRAVGAKHASKH